MLDPGPNQEVVYVAKHISPWPATGPNVVLTAPLAKDHAAGVSTAAMSVTLTAPLTLPHASGVTVSNPRPVISAAKATELKGLLADATAKANATPADTAGAIASLQQFVTAAAATPALSSSGSALIDQLNGKPVDTTGTGVTVGAAEPDVQAIRVFNNPLIPVAIPNAKYKILVTGRSGPSGAFRHEAIVDFEWMIQQLGAAERLRRRHLGPEHQRQPGPPDSGRRLADDQPVPRSQHAQAVQDDRVRLDRRP